MPLPQTQIGTVLWRPVLPHLLTGLAPVDMPLDYRTIERDGVLRHDPVQGWANWGDVDGLGSPPMISGWRVGQTRRVGTPLMLSDPARAPRHWTHLRIVRLMRRKIYGKLRLTARVEVCVGGRQQLFDRALEWFDEAVAPDLGPDLAEAHRLRIFDQDLWEKNWEPYEKPIVAEGPEA